jgi:hypothetical protein
MRETRITLPELVLIAGTRVALGFGLGLLLAPRFPEGERRGVGWTLLSVGALSTIPLALEVFGRSRMAEPESPESEPAPSLMDRLTRHSEALRA